MTDTPQRDEVPGAKRFALTGTLLIAFGMGLFPPWTLAVGNARKTDAGYAFVGSPPTMYHWNQGFTPFTRGDEQPSHRGLSPPAEARNVAEDPSYFPRINLERLLVQWAALAALAGCIPLIWPNPARDQRSRKTASHELA